MTGPSKIPAPATDAIAELWPPFRHVVADIVLAIGWKVVAAKIRRYGWRENAENLITRVEKALNWSGYRDPKYRNAHERMGRALGVLRHLHAVASARTRGGAEPIRYIQPVVDDGAYLKRTVTAWRIDAAIEPVFNVFLVGVGSIEEATNLIETKCVEWWHASGPRDGPVVLDLDGPSTLTILIAAISTHPERRLALSEVSERLGAAPAAVQKKLASLVDDGVLVIVDSPSGSTRWYCLANGERATSGR